jgi:heme-degrading monooxygenase HmoA
LTPASLTSFYLFGVPTRGIPRAFARMAFDRGALKRTPGLRFWKLLGTGDGRTFSPRDADPRRWALLTVWETPGDLQRFERSSPVLRRWGRVADERWRADLVPLRVKGRWSRREPFEVPNPAQATTGSVAALTRARLKLNRARTFRRAVPPVACYAAQAPGLRFALAIGEAPVGVQGTFSVWDDAAALESFAYRNAPHRDVVRRTPRVGWYSEELFARFAVEATEGTVEGVDPLAA